VPAHEAAAARVAGLDGHHGPLAVAVVIARTDKFADEIDRFFEDFNLGFGWRRPRFTSLRRELRRHERELEKVARSPRVDVVEREGRSRSPKEPTQRRPARSSVMGCSRSRCPPRSMRRFVAVRSRSKRRPRAPERGAGRRLALRGCRGWFGIDVLRGAGRAPAVVPASLPPPLAGLLQRARPAPELISRRMTGLGLPGDPIVQAEQNGPPSAARPVREPGSKGGGEPIDGLIVEMAIKRGHRSAGWPRSSRRQPNHCNQMNIMNKKTFSLVTIRGQAGPHPLRLQESVA
jgi:hypothetical protein